MQEHTSLQKDKVETSINIREELDKYLVHWKWIVLSLLISLFLAIVYLRYAVPVYKASATILVKDDRKGGLQSELAAFSDLGLSSGLKSNIDNEIEIIKSRTVVEKAIKKLGINISYFAETRVKSVELYKDKPFEFVFFNEDENFYESSKQFQITIFNSKSFEIFKDEKSLGKFKFGEKVKLPNSDLIVYYTSKSNKIFNDNFIVRVNNLKNVVQAYNSKLNIESKNKNSSVVEISMVDPLKERAEDVINTIIEIYNQEAIDDKKFISESTQRFIQNRLKMNAIELGDVEKDAEQYKKYNNVTDIVSEAGLYVQNSAAFEKELIETETQVRVVASMQEFMRSKKKDALVPLNILPGDASSLSAIMEHNELVLQRNRLIKDGTLSNPIIQNLDSKIDETNKNINESISRLRASLLIKKIDLQKQSSSIKGKISQIPTQEREFRIIDRQQKIKESLYLYLLQKREEIAISLAVTSPNSKLIDSAMSSTNPVSPVRNMIYLIALALGLGLPIGIIYINQLLDTKLKNRQDIEGKTSIPFLGDVPKSESNSEIMNTNSRSSSAEAIRIIRTNLEFLLSNAKKDSAKTIFVTSTLPKEGKTFVAVNLASTIAISGKKTLLIGLDIRNPKLDEYIKLPSKGLTNFLSKNDENIDDYIVKLDGFEDFSILPSGVIPPNPVDLLMNDKLTNLFESLKKKYDYIVVDTAPVSLVTDTLLIAKNADAFIYVMRANYLDKRFIKVADSFYIEKKLPNMAIILNDTVWGKTYGYGYGYGYGQEIKKETLFKKLINKFFKT